MWVILDALSPDLGHESHNFALLDELFHHSASEALQTISLELLEDVKQVDLAIFVQSECASRTDDLFGGRNLPF